MEWKPEVNKGLNRRPCRVCRAPPRRKLDQVFLTRWGNAHEREWLIGMRSLTCVFAEEKKEFILFHFLFLVFAQIDTRLGQYIEFVNIFGIYFTFLNGEMHGLRINSRTEVWKKGITIITHYVSLTNGDLKCLLDSYFSKSRRRRPRNVTHPERWTNRKKWEKSSSEPSFLVRTS